MAKYMMLLAVLMTVVAVTYATILESCITCDESAACATDVSKTGVCATEGAVNAFCQTKATYAEDGAVSVMRACAAACDVADSRTENKGAGVAMHCCDDVKDCNKDVIEKGAPKDGAASVVVSSALMMVSVFVALKGFF